MEYFKTEVIGVADLQLGCSKFKYTKVPEKRGNDYFCGGSLLFSPVGIDPHQICKGQFPGTHAQIPSTREWVGLQCVRPYTCRGNEVLEKTAVTSVSECAVGRRTQPIGNFVFSYVTYKFLVKGTERKAFFVDQGQDRLCDELSGLTQQPFTSSYTKEFDTRGYGVGELEPVVAEKCQIERNKVLDELRAAGLI